MGRALIKLPKHTTGQKVIKFAPCLEICTPRLSENNSPSTANLQINFLKENMVLFFVIYSIFMAKRLICVLCELSG